MAIYQITEVHPESAWYDLKDTIEGTIIQATPKNLILYRDSIISRHVGISGEVLNSREPSTMYGCDITIICKVKRLFK